MTRLLPLTSLSSNVSNDSYGQSGACMASCVDDARPEAEVWCKVGSLCPWSMCAEAALLQKAFRKHNGGYLPLTPELSLLLKSNQLKEPIRWPCAMKGKRRQVPLLIFFCCSSSYCTVFTSSWRRHVAVLLGNFSTCFVSVRTSQYCSYQITKIFVRRMKWLNLWVGPCASSAMREAASKGNPMAAPAPAQEEDRWTADRCCTVAIVAYQSYPTVTTQEI